MSSRRHPPGISATERSLEKVLLDALGKSDLLPYWPRLLGRKLAASYLQISPTFFDKLVKDGRMPPPLRINGRRLRAQIDLYVQALRDGEDDNDDDRCPEPQL